MLRVEGVSAGYGGGQTLRDLSLTAARGQITCLMGRNGAGKTTLMRAIMGLMPLSAGRVMWGDRVLSDLAPHRVAGQGVGFVPQGRRLFGALSVAENLAMGMQAGRGGAAARDAALARFPRLVERLDQPARTLSGGEQTMLAVARALCVGPDLMLLDEPTEGLQPSMIGAIRDVLLDLRAEGRTILLVEQRLDAVLGMADRVVVMDAGRVVAAMTGDAARADPGGLRGWVGV